MRTERTFLGRALTYIGKRVGYATRGHSLHFQAVTSRRRFGLRLTALGSGLGAGAAAGAAAAGLGRRLGENSVQGHVRGGCGCWRWRQRKRAKRREDEGVRDGGRERERESKLVCAHVPVPPIVPRCTALHRETTLPSYVSLFHIASTHPPS